MISKPSEANMPVLKSDDSNDIQGYAFVYNNPNRIITVDPNVKLIKPGYYEFRLNATDGEKTNHADYRCFLFPAGKSL